LRKLKSSSKSKTLLTQQFFFRVSTLLVLFLVPIFSIAQSNNQFLRLAIIKVDSTQLKSYNDFLKEEVEASIRVEPGVITLYAVAEKENPEHVTLFETYADSARYKSHIATPHFQKYKKGTMAMVKDLQLIETNPIFYVKRNDLEKANTEKLFIRLIKIEIDSSQIQNFNQLATEVMLPNVKKEKGVLVMYAVAEKLYPTRVTVLEVYCDEASYTQHIKTPHFLRYKNDSQRMIRSLKLIDVRPILLGAKPHIN
jgi:quinol monooxygenase YgiN